ncbi:ethanolaminephosphotransferase [Babesia microti strain RI]|uniref:Ethanolaminephosphotransferase n=1 Tax=Babesia microti (strain RI) TaxID=1133968 RepID=A0A1N6LYC3_BABMR|nr:ethanolaminephosphotransferase [Babesia microti strain RI]SIO73878.1 ethanolaminephosphotransferase [Babesia microti strain RI]|eukprot:XP_021337930.1 ethanolaminephosphotransferase [Babesia microti strain RI]
MSKRAWHPSLLPVIPVQSVPHLENYKFTPAQQGCVDSFLTKYWWNVIARAMPPSIHPNVVTIIGSVFMLFAFTISIAHVTGLILKKTACIYFTIAFCVFMYQTCDGIDGIMSRRLGLSSPLGQFLDHGFDTIYAILWPLFLLVIFDCDFNVFFHLSLFAVYIQLVLIMFKEQDKGVFYSHNNFTCVTHAQFMTILSMIIKGTYGMEWAMLPLKSTNIGRILFSTFLAKMIPAYWNVYHLILFVVITCNAIAVMIDVITTFGAYKQKSTLAKLMLSAAIHFMFIYAVHCYKPLGKGGFFSKPTLPKTLRMLMYAFTLLCFSSISIYNLICVVCKVQMTYGFTHLIPIYFFLSLYYLKYVLGVTLPKIDKIFTTHENLTLLFAGAAGYCALYIVHHFVCVVLEIKHHLGLTVFYVKPRISSARKF